MRILFVHSVKQAPWITDQIVFFENEGISIDNYIIERPKSITGLIKDGFKLRRLSAGYDVVHAQWGSTTGLITALFSKAKNIVTICGSDLLGNYDKNLKKSYKGSISVICSKLSFLFTNLIFVRAQVLKNNVAIRLHKKVLIIPNPVDYNIFYPIQREEACKQLGLNESSFKIVFVSFGGSAVKNYPLAEKIFNEVKSGYQNVEMLLASGLTKKQLNQYYNAANLLLITSFHEGSNNSLKEAMSVNTPVISSTSGDADERLRGVTNSMVFDINNEQPAINFINNSLLHQRPHSNGRQVLEQQGLNATQLYQKVLSVYKDLANK